MDIRRCPTHRCDYDNKNGCSFCPDELDVLLVELLRAHYCQESRPSMFEFIEVHQRGGATETIYHLTEEAERGLCVGKAFDE